MDCIDREWNNPEEREKRMRDRMNIMYPYNISHCKMWIDKVSNEDIARWEQLSKMEDIDEILEGERQLHYIELIDIIRDGEYAKKCYYDKLNREVEEEYDKRKIECYMGRVKDVDEDELIDVAYIDSCAGEHIWRMDSGRKFLKDVGKQEGKCVRGITGDRVKLSESGIHDILGKVYGRSSM